MFLKQGHKDYQYFNIVVQTSKQIHLFFKWFNGEFVFISQQIIN
jgi:hypothetical protein